MYGVLLQRANADKIKKLLRSEFSTPKVRMWIAVRQLSGPVLVILLICVLDISVMVIESLDKIVLLLSALKFESINNKEKIILKIYESL